jgi:hypothetical protein
MNQDQVLEVPHRQLLEKSAAAGDMHANIELGMNAVANRRLEQAESYFKRAGPNSAAAAANLQELRGRDEVIVNQPAPPATASANEALAAARKYHRGRACRPTSWRPFATTGWPNRAAASRRGACWA